MSLISLPVFYCSSVKHVSICIQDKALNDSEIQWAMFLPLGSSVEGLYFPSSSYLLVGKQEKAGGVNCFLDQALNRETL